MVVSIVNFCVSGFRIDDSVNGCGLVISLFVFSCEIFSRFDSRLLVEFSVFWIWCRKLLRNLEWMCWDIVLVSSCVVCSGWIRLWFIVVRKWVLVMLVCFVLCMVFFNWVV